MNYNLNLTERNYESYPIVIIPANIIDSFIKEIHYTEILTFLGERYYPLRKVYNFADVFEGLLTFVNNFQSTSVGD